MDTLDLEASKTERQLWSYKTAMLQKSGYKRFFGDSIKDWTEVNSRAATARKFQSNTNQSLLVSIDGCEA